jgi:hypothetical protein
MELLSQRAVRKLAGLLYLPIQDDDTPETREWRGRQTEKMNRLPQILMRTTNPLLGLAVRFTEKYKASYLPSAAILCPTHKALDPWLIRRLFILLAAEVTVRSDRFRSFHGSEKLPLTESISSFVQRMNGVSALWLDAAFFDAAFGTRAPESLPSVKSKCEACIMAVVGAHDQVLVDLRANMLARSRSGTVVPRFLRLVDEWIDHFNEKDAAAINAQADVLASELRVVRKETTRLRKMRKDGKRGDGKKGPYQQRVRKMRTTKEGYPVPKKPSQRSSSKPTSTFDSKHGIPKLTEGEDEDNFTQIDRPEDRCEFYEDEEDDIYDNGTRPDNYELGHEYGQYELDDDDDEGTLQAEEHRADGPTYEEQIMSWYVRSTSALGSVSQHNNDVFPDSDRIHPAFRDAVPSFAPSFSAKSAIPRPLKVNKNDAGGDDDDDRSYVTVTVHTDRDDEVANIPVPRIPSQYGTRRADTDQRLEAKATGGLPAGYGKLGATTPPGSRYNYPSSSADSGESCGKSASGEATLRASRLNYASSSVYSQDEDDHKEVSSPRTPSPSRKQDRASANFHASSNRYSTPPTPKRPLLDNVKSSLSSSAATARPKSRYLSQSSTSTTSNAPVVFRDPFQSPRRRRSRWPESQVSLDGVDPKESREGRHARGVSTSLAVDDTNDAATVLPDDSISVVASQRRKAAVNSRGRAAGSYRTS